MKNTVAQNTETRSSAGECLGREPADGRLLEARQRSIAWSVLDLDAVDDPTDIGHEIRLQVAWLSTFDHQTAEGHELRDIDLDESIGALREFAKDVDQMANAYEYATAKRFAACVVGCAVAPPFGDKFGLSIRKIANQIVDEFRTVVSGGSRAGLHLALSSLASLSLEVDALAAWLGHESPTSEVEARSLLHTHDAAAEE